MKRLLLFTLIFCLSIATRGMSSFEYREGDRFSLLYEIFDFYDFEAYHYTPYRFFYEPDDPEMEVSGKGVISESVRQNVDLWRQRCRNGPSTEAVYAAIYQSTEDSTNVFLQYLRQHKDQVALDYLTFAKSCEAFNQELDDPWERNQNMPQFLRRNKISEAQSKISQVTDTDIQRRYAFLLIRLAYYNGDVSLVQSVYKTYFEDTKTKDIIYYWSTYFKVITKDASAENNVDAARVFAKAPDKRFMTLFRINRDIPIQQCLQLAKNKDDRTALLLVYQIRNMGKALPAIQQMHAINPKAEGLDFMLFRELCKIESWKLEADYMGSWTHGPLTQQQQNNNRVYIQQVLSFVESVDCSQVKQAIVWQTARIYLQFMLGGKDQKEGYQQAIQLSNRLLSQQHPPKIQTLLQRIKALGEIAIQEGPASIPPSVQTLLMQDSVSNVRFIFAVARQLEWSGNTTDGVCLLSHIAPDRHWNEWYYENSFSWFGGNRYVETYFTYLDAQYTPQQVKQLIDVSKGMQLSKFDQWKYRHIHTDINRLYDLLGTMYIRKDQLPLALKAFEQVNDSLWTSNAFAYSTYLDANPFYADMYSQHKKTLGDTIRYTKTSITRTLMDYLAKAEDVHNKDRDYYYFLVANCYYNMSNYGNSWMMRRYSTTSVNDLSFDQLPDRIEYDQAIKAQAYYTKARTYSQSAGFSALCLRMVAKCETLNLLKAVNYYYYPGNDALKKLNSKNRSLQALRKQYPQYSEDLISRCMSFRNYFKERQNLVQ